MFRASIISLDLPCTKGYCGLLQIVMLVTALFWNNRDLCLHYRD